MANVIHLVIHIHKHRKQPKEEQHLRRVLSHHPLRQVQPRRLAIRLHLNLQTLLLIYQIQIIPLIITPPGYLVQQLSLSMELLNQLIISNGIEQHLSLAY